jgi:hypothetical protein
MVAVAPFMCALVVVAAAALVAQEWSEELQSMVTKA